MAHRHKRPSAGPDRVLWVLKTSWAWLALAVKFLQVPPNRVLAFPSPTTSRSLVPKETKHLEPNFFKDWVLC